MRGLSDDRLVGSLNDELARVRRFVVMVGVENEQFEKIDHALVLLSALGPNVKKKITAFEEYCHRLSPYTILDKEEEEGGVKINDDWVPTAKKDDKIDREYEDDQQAQRRVLLASFKQLKADGVLKQTI